MKLSVHIAAMPDLKDRDSFFDVVDFVNHTIVANANSPALPIAKFLAARWSGTVAGFKDFCFHRFVDWRVQPRELFFRVRQDAKLVTHLPFLSRSILSMASSNGTGVVVCAQIFEVFQFFENFFVFFDADDHGDFLAAFVHNELAFFSHLELVK
jgi:hypothetical protein